MLLLPQFSSIRREVVCLLVLFTDCKLGTPCAGVLQNLLLPLVLEEQTNDCHTRIDSVGYRKYLFVGAASRIEMLPGV